MKLDIETTDWNEIKNKLKESCYSEIREYVKKCTETQVNKEYTTIEGKIDDIIGAAIYSNNKNLMSTILYAIHGIHDMYDK